MNKEQLIHEIGSRLIEDIGARKNEWSHVVLVGIFEKNDPEMTGFVYFKDRDYQPVAPRDFNILELLTKLRHAMAVDDKKPPWLACLIRINRDLGDIQFDFEYDNASRWEIKLTNSKKKAKELSPFEDST